MSATHASRFNWIDDVTSIPLTLALAMPVGVFYLTAFITAPRIEQMAGELGAEMPALTVASFKITRWMVTAGWTFLWLVPLGLPMLMTRLGHSRRRTVRGVGRLLWGMNVGFVLSLLVVAWYALTLLLPWLGMIDKLSEP